MSPGSTIRAAPARREWRTGEESEAGHDVSAPQLAPAERLAVRPQSRAGRPLAGRVAATVVRGTTSDSDDRQIRRLRLCVVDRSFTIEQADKQDRSKIGGKETYIDRMHRRRKTA